MPITIDGKWCLIGEADDEADIPSHHVAFVFRGGPGQIHGALINRVNGAETPLASLLFDGAALDLQLPNQTQEGHLGMTQAGERFEGYWMNSASERIGPKLKLVRGE